VKKKIAVFDFDGTITTKDTLLEFIKFNKGSFAFYSGLLLNLPYLVAFKIKIISNQSAKEKVLKFFFHDTPLAVFKNNCVSFSKEILPGLIRKKALEEIKRLQGEGITVAIVSASPQDWIQDWADEIGALLIASQLEIKNGKITGNLSGKNCHGNEKVRRICETFDLSKYEVVAAYGDSSGDKPMLALAAQSFYRPF
jgi:HAD superfamily hydrolase (TIGR01490 family)